MTEKNGSKEKADRRARLMEKCQACMALLVKCGSSLESAIAACRDLAMEKVFSKEPTGNVK